MKEVGTFIMQLVMHYPENWSYGNMFLKSLSFGSKECTKELKLECANFLGQTS